MSYILKALRKAEQARQIEQTPSLHGSLIHPPQQQQKKWLMIFLILCNVILLSLVFLYFLKSEAPGKMQNLVTDQAGKTNVMPIILDPGEGLAENGASQNKSDITGDRHDDHASSNIFSENASTINRANEQGDDVQLGELARTTYATLQDLKVSEARSGLHSNPSSTQDQAGVKARADKVPATPAESAEVLIEQLSTEMPHRRSYHRPALDMDMSQPQSSEQRHGSGMKSIPFLQELPHSFRRTVPKITINVYAYGEDVRERFVIVDMVRFSEGQQITDGLWLEEIQPDYLVVTFSGKTFRIKRP